MYESTKEASLFSMHKHQGLTEDTNIAPCFFFIIMISKCNLNGTAGLSKL